MEHSVSVCIVFIPSCFLNLSVCSVELPSHVLSEKGSFGFVSYDTVTGLLLFSAFHALSERHFVSALIQVIEDSIYIAFDDCICALSLEAFTVSSVSPLVTINYHNGTVKSRWNTVQNKQNHFVYFTDLRENAQIPVDKVQEDLIY